MRLSLSAKLILSVGLVVALLAGAMAVSRVQSRIVGEKVRVITEFAEPAGAAAAEMETNLNRTGFAVLGYLRDRDPKHLERINEDTAGFARYRERARRASPSPAALGARVDDGYSRLLALAHKLIEREDQRDASMKRAMELVHSLAKLLEAIVEPAVRQPSPALEKMNAVREIESGMHGASLAVLDFARRQEEGTERRVGQRLDALAAAVGRFERLPLDVRERRLAARIGTAHAEFRAAARETVDLGGQQRRDLAEFAAIRRTLGDILDDEIQRPTERNVAEANAELRRALVTGDRVILALLLLGVGLATLKAASLIREMNERTREFVNLTRFVGNASTDGQAVARHGDEYDVVREAIHSLGERLASEREILRQRSTDVERVNVDLWEANQKAQEAMAAKSAFLAVMSHEIRTPLNAVTGMTGLLLDTPLSEEQQDYAQSIRVSANTLLTHINHVLDFTKIESGKVELEPVEFELAEMIDDVFDLVAVQARENEVAVSCAFHPEAPRFVKTDLARLQQVLLNLCANAVKFTRKGEVVVHIDAARTAGERIELRFAVQDTGVGIPAAALSRLFQPFSQADNSISRRYGGTGLGLAVAARLVEMLGGRISVESREGKGARFEFTVLVDRVARAQEPPRGEFVGRKVVVVSEHEPTLQMHAYQCLRAGMAVYAFREPVEAIEWMRAGHTVDGAVVDFSMPGMSAMQLARALRELGKARRLPIVLLAAGGHKEIGGDAGVFFALLVKPVRASTVLDALARALQGTWHPLPRPLQDPISQQSLRRSSGPRILVADDHDINQKVAVKVLERLGVAADVAGNGREVLEALERKSYDVVIMDVQMPEMDGIEATREIVRRYGSARPRIIALTANASSSDREECLATGMDDYLAKPFTRQQLAKALGLPGLELEDTPAATSDPASAEVLDAETIAMLENLYVDDPAALGELLGSFAARAQHTISLIAAAVTAADSKELTVCAHKLKGAAGAVGARALCELAAELEQRGKANERRDNAKRINALRDCFERTHAALQRVMELIPPGNDQGAVQRTAA